jgi:GNAT superfamily N-acetyltransferase
MTGIICAPPYAAVTMPEGGPHPQALDAGRLGRKGCAKLERAMHIEIRPLQPSDRAVWEELFDAYAAFYKTTTTPAGKQATWEWIFSAEDFWADLALQNGKVVGLCQYQLMHRSLSGAKVVYLSDLYVRPDLRGGGIGRAMIDHVIGFAKSNGFTNVRWLTQEFNYAGRRLYDSYRPKSDFILYSVPVEA